MSHRKILVVRHGTKVEMDSRFDLPIRLAGYCKDDTTFRIAAKFPMENTMIFTSPFIRTKQTAARLAKEIGYKKPIYIIDAFGEAFAQVSKQLSKCGEKNQVYRVPKSPVPSVSSMSSLDRTNSDSVSYSDECMLTMVSDHDLQILDGAAKEIAATAFSDVYNMYFDPENATEHEVLFVHALKQLAVKFPTRNLIIVTHGRNVMRAIKALDKRRRILGGVPPTCGHSLFEGNGLQTKLVHTSVPVNMKLRGFKNRRRRGVVRRSESESDDDSDDEDMEDFRF